MRSDVHTVTESFVVDIRTLVRAATTPASGARFNRKKESKEGKKERKKVRKKERQAHFSLYLFLPREGGEGEEALLVDPCVGSWPRDRRSAVGHCAFFVSPILRAVLRCLSACVLSVGLYRVSCERDVYVRRSLPPATTIRATPPPLSSSSSLSSSPSSPTISQHQRMRVQGSESVRQCARVTRR